MAKAKYHKSQRVFVKPVGTWAHVEAVVPKWVKGCEEPIKISYECGMVRAFAQEELEESSPRSKSTPETGSGRGASFVGTIAGRAPTNASITPSPAPIRWS